MKKLLALLLTAALLTGCAAAGITTVPSTTPPDTTAPPATTDPVINIGDHGTDVEGAQLVIESIDNTIHARWENHTDWMITYGYGYDLEVKKGDTWVSCAIADVSWIDLACELAPGSKSDMTYDLRFFDITAEETYRLTSNCSIQYGDKAERCRVWAEFTVGETVKEPLTDDDKLLQSVEKCDFSAQYIRTNGYHDGAEYPAVTVIRSVEELNTYYEQYKELYDLERKDKVYSDTTIGFLDACDKYDNAYFENQALILILLEVGSGSVRHDVYKAGFSGEEFVVALDSYMPGGVGTCDMAEWHIFVEPEAGVQVPDDITVFYNGKNVTKDIQTVSYSYGHANMALQLPEGWEYSVSEYNAESYSFGIEFWPKGYSDNKITLHYWHKGGFGVCGTGLSEETVTLANYTARAGTYDGAPYWSFVVFPDLAGQYVVEMFGAGAWWDTFGEEAASILHSITLARDIIDKNDAVWIAKEKAGQLYQSHKTEFDYETGIWTITLYNHPNADADVTIRIDASGNIIDIQ